MHRGGLDSLRARAMEEQPVKDEPAQPMASGSGNCERFPSGLRIMAVDDDPLCLKVVEQMLKRCDYKGAAIQSFNEYVL